MKKTKLIYFLVNVSLKKLYYIDRSLASLFARFWIIWSSSWLDPPPIWTYLGLCLPDSFYAADGELALTLDILNNLRYAFTWIENESGNFVFAELCDWIISFWVVVEFKGWADIDCRALVWTRIEEIHFTCFHTAASHDQYFLVVECDREKLTQFWKSLQAFLRDYLPFL